MQRQLRIIRIWKIFTVLLIFLMISCTSPRLDMYLPEPILRVYSYTQTPTQTIEPTTTPTITPTATTNPLVTLTPTTDPFPDLYMDALMERTYGGGVVEDAGELNGGDGFSRNLFKYRSEGLDLYGFINLPDGDGPFPILVLLHGYIDPAKYNTLDYSVRYADVLAKAGYLTIHPNLRGYATSDDGENRLGIGDTIDVLNLLALVRQQSGSEGLLEKGDSSRIGLWGHSMGGGIALRILIIDREIKGGLLYASINSNEEFNLAHFEKDGRGREKLIAPSSALAKISPSTLLHLITAPVSIHHGGRDDVVPVEWSSTLCDSLVELEKVVQCKEYPDQAHTFQNSGDVEFTSDMVAFFDMTVK